MGTRIGVRREDVARAIVDYIADTGRAPNLQDIAYRLEIGITEAHGRVRELRAAGFLADARPNQRGAIWPRALLEVLQDSARYMATKDLAIPGVDV